MIKKYRENTISPEEFDRLKGNVNKIPDPELSDAIEDIWKQSSQGMMDAATKRGVRESLSSKLRPAGIGRLRRFAIAAAVLIPMLAASAIFFAVRTDRPASQQVFTVFTEGGQKTRMYLPDGTKVWLNSGSTLEYDNNYNSGNRRVKMTGEAFFDVAKSEAAGFIVDAGGISVLVHGTAFNVTSYEQDQTISVSLNRGKVSVENASDHSLIAELSPDQQLVISKKDLSGKVYACDAEYESLWTQNKLRLEDASTAELFKAMEHWYGVSITTGNAIPSNRYSLTIKTESLSEMLDLINRLTPIKYTINGEEVTITYK